VGNNVIPIVKLILIPISLRPVLVSVGTIALVVRDYSLYLKRDYIVALSKSASIDLSKNLCFRSWFGTSVTLALAIGNPFKNGYIISNKDRQKSWGRVLWLFFWSR